MPTPSLCDLANAAAQAQGIKKKLSRSEFKNLIKILSFFLSRTKEPKDFLIIKNLVKKYFLNLRKPNNFKSQTVFIFYLVKNLTTVKKRSAVNNYGGRPRLLNLTNEEYKFISREQTKNISKDELAEALKNLAFKA